MADITDHPDYELGFLDAKAGESLPSDDASPYRSGWYAWHEVKAILDKLRLKVVPSAKDEK